MHSNTKFERRRLNNGNQKKKLLQRGDDESVHVREREEIQNQLMIYHSFIHFTNKTEEE